MASGFGMSAAHALAPSASFDQPAIVLASAGAEARNDASFNLKGVMHSFIRVEDANTTKVAAAEPNADECPTEKDKSNAADAKEAKKADKTAPQGPEPIYFAF
jgi:hypothetical protein